MTIRRLFARFIFCSYLALLGLTCALAQETTIHVSGEINENITWAADTVKVHDTITVNIGYTLTIEAGTYVEFQGWFPLVVHGTIIAIGTESEPIIFTINDTTGFSNNFSYDGSWHGIRFLGAEDTSRLQYCVLEYGRAIAFESSIQYNLVDPLPYNNINSGWWDQTGGAILIFSS